MAGKWVSLRRALRLATAGLDLFDKAEGLDASLPIMAESANSPLYGITRRSAQSLRHPFSGTVRLF
jgi:hypothetical protein